MTKDFVELSLAARKGPNSFGLVTVIGVLFQNFKISFDKKSILIKN